MTSLTARTVSSAHAELRTHAEEGNSMAMPHQTWPRQGEWTVEEMWQLPDDGNRYEVIDGVLHVTPSPTHRHQDAVLALARKLAAYLETGTLGWVYVAPSDVVFASGRAVQPDVYVAPLVHGRRPTALEDVHHLLLAVEVLSPGTADDDRGAKRRLYQQHADEYWIVDLDARVVERWRPADDRPQALDDSLEWRPAGADTPLALDLPAFFRDVLEG
jgi:Uma2 family endonuclease